MITINNNKIMVCSRKYNLMLDTETGTASLSSAEGGLLFEFPLDLEINTSEGSIHMSAPLRPSVCGNTLCLEAIRPDLHTNKQVIEFDFFEDDFTVRFSCHMATGAKLKVGNIEYFRDPQIGMRLNTMKQGFSVPNAGLSEEDYKNIFPFVSCCGLFTPPVLTIGMGFANGFVGLGLLDLPNSTGFGVVHPLMGLLVDSFGQNITWSDDYTYIGPKVVFMFPQDGWDCLKQFRNTLEHHNRLPIMPTEKPDWWKRPMYCTYGDQIMEMQPALYTARYWDVVQYDQKWAMHAVKRAEEKLGYKEFTVIFDAFWQKAWDTDPESDKSRFSDMRDLIEKLHERGHKVLLWYSPHAVNINRTNYGSLARQYGLLGTYIDPAKPLLAMPDLNYLDYTAKQADAYLHELARRLFSAEDDALNCDGLKMDFLFFIPPVEQGAKYLDPAKGMGIMMVKRYLEMFNSSAKFFKSDILLNYSGMDPRIAHLFDMNRLHDTKVTYIERERRARASAIANPDLLIDSDGAVMFSDWVEHTYISAAIYSTPSLYYVDVFNDGQKLSDKDMNTLGKLFDICSRRTFGRPEFRDYGCWLLRDPISNNIIGESYNGKFCWLQTSANSAEGIGFNDQHLKIGFHGRNLKSIIPKPEQMSVDGETITAHWRGGQVYRFLF